MSIPSLLVAVGVATTLAWGQTGSSSPRPVPLAPGLFKDADRVPLAVLHEIGDRLPPTLVSGHFPARRRGRSLVVHASGPSRQPRSVHDVRPALVRIQATPPRTVLLLHRRGRWYGAPSRCLRGKVEGESLVFLDGDGDGRHGHPGDWVGLGRGPLVPCTAARLLLTRAGLRRYALNRKADRWFVTLHPLARVKGSDPRREKSLLALNRFRTGVGLPPLTLDPAWCRGCRRHADYLYLNGFDLTACADGKGPHTQAPDNTWYTPEGLEAARNGLVWPTREPAWGVRVMRHTPLHRIGLLGNQAGGYGVGISSADKRLATKGFAVIRTPKLRIATPAEIVVVPGQDQRNVPILGHGEYPGVYTDPGFYDKPRGYPVSVTFGKLPLKDYTLKVFAGRSRKPLAGRTFSPYEPVHPRYPANKNSIFFVAARPLALNTVHWAEFSATYKGRPFFRAWTFKTGRGSDCPITGPEAMRREKD